MFKSALALVRRSISSHDTSTAETRATARNRNGVLTAFAGAFSKALAIGTILITVPLTLKYLGNERYGMWMTTSSLVAMLSFADFGIGNGTMSAIAHAYGANQIRLIRQLVASSFLALGAISLAILTVFAAIYTFVPWHTILNVYSVQASREAGPVFAALISCFAVAIPLNVVQRVQLGIQKGFLANLWQCAGSIMALVGVVLAIKMRASLPCLILIYAGSPLVASFLNGVLFFRWQAPQLRPRIRDVSRQALRSITITGIAFFGIQIIGAITFSSDNIVLAHLVGSAAVVEYAVPQRLFIVIPTIVNLALMPLWPAYGEAIARGDQLWVWRTTIKSLRSSVALASIGSFTLVIAGDWLMGWWVGHRIVPSLSLLIGLGVWQIVQVAGAALAMYLNGARIVRFQLVSGAITAITAIALKMLFVPIIGVSGVVWATVVSYFFCAGVPSYYVFCRNRNAFFSATPAGSTSVG